MRILSIQAAVTMFLLGVVGDGRGTATAWAQNGAALSKNEVLKILRDGNLPGGQKAAFDAFFEGEIFTPFEKAAATTDTYYNLRRQLRNYQTWSRKGAAHDALNILTLRRMTRILGGDNSKYSRAAKVNAMLLIGDLNEEDGTSKPKPLAAAFPFLLGMVSTTSAKYGDDLKVAALIGLERHAAAGAIPAAKKDDVTKVMLDLVNQQEPPANRTAAGHDWMRRRAAQVLANMGSPGPNNSVVNALAAVAADPRARPTLRCEVAQYLGQFKYPPAAKVDLQALSNALGHQAVEICNRELAEASAADRVPSRRLIMYSLHSANEGLAGLQAAAAGTPHKKFVTDLADKVKKIHAELDDPELEDKSLAMEVSAKLTDLQSILAPKPPAASEPDKKESVAAKEVAAAGSKDKRAEPVKK